ncbi:MAG: pyridoxamine 5'-phosphate oxidase family protein [Synergistaceae bacterium]|jgi:general stress protein 26|nr:pyridoxamine 5'-phosphate oxidase family protein [Synergistaceae bacterium]
MRIDETGHKDTRAKAEKLLAESKVVFMGTNGSHGHPNLRAMIPLRTDEVRTVWFATDLDSSKIIELVKNNKAVLYTYSQKTLAECRFWGNVSILDDATSRKHVWCEEIKKHYNDPDDPNFRVLRFDISNGIFCSNKEGKSGSFSN